MIIATIILLLAGFGCFAGFMFFMGYWEFHDVALRDDQPSCSVAYWFLEPEDMFIVRLNKTYF